MKRTQECPKCGSRKLWRIDEIGTKDTGKVPLLLAADRRTPPVRDSALVGLFGDGSKSYDAGPIDAYTCAACGFTELWARDFERLVHNPASGVHFIDATPQKSEYR